MRQVSDDNGWRPIETAPKGVPILLWDGDTIVVGLFLPNERRPFIVAPVWHGLTEDLDVYATHWQPLPAPPDVAA